MANSLPSYVLDSYALLAYFQAEAGGLQVRTLVEAGRDAEATLGVSIINAGEVYYLMQRQRGQSKADSLLKDLHDLPLTFYSATDERVWAAARLKAQYPISYADAFAAALAAELKATLVTGDPEFESLENSLNILWLPRK